MSETPLSTEQSVAGCHESRWELTLPLALATSCFVVCWGIFIWASYRGFDFRDEAYYLLWEATPFSYQTSTSDFAYIWHPLYVAAGGKIALYRIFGALCLGLCAATFGIALTRFVNGELKSPTTQLTIVVASTTAAFWEFPIWEPSPNYNELNLAALLLYVAGLLLAEVERSDAHVSRNFLSASFLPAVLAGTAFGLLSLNKPTSAVASLVFAISWIVLVRPRKPLPCIFIAAAAACVVVTALVFEIDGSFAAFAHRKLATFGLLFVNSGNRDVHGIWSSVVGPFLPERRWKIWPAAELGAIIFSISLVSLSLTLLPIRLIQRVRMPLLVTFAASLGVIVMLWRTKDLGGTTVFPAFHAWHFSLLLLLMALAMIVFTRGLLDMSESYTRSRVSAAIIISFAPLAYSIGTANPLVLHMTSASIFWVGASILLVSQISEDQRVATLRFLGVIVGFVTVGLLLGVMSAPGLIGHPMWEQDVGVELGPADSFLLVDRPTARYIADARTAAHLNGFKDDTPVIDVSDMGPGIIYAINGRASGAPWLTDNEMTGNAADGMAYTNAVLSSIPRDELVRSWVITSPGANANMSTSWLGRVHLGFPSRYDFAGAARRNDFGWSQLLWRPRKSTFVSDVRKPQIN